MVSSYFHDDGRRRHQDVDAVLAHPDERAALSRLCQYPEAALTLIDQELKRRGGWPVDPAWLETVFEELVEAAAGAAGGRRSAAAVRPDAPDQGEDARTGRAFASVFVRDTPGWLLDLDRVFARAERIDERIAADLLENPAVRNGGDLARRLVRYGLTPASVLDAGVSMGNTLRDALWDGEGEEGPAFILFPDHAARAGGPFGPALTMAALVEPFRRISGMPAATADALVAWILDLGRVCKPFVIDGFRLRPIAEGLAAEPLPDILPSVDALWRSVEPPSADGR